MSSILGIFLHAVGGFAAGSFYIPFKRVRDWAWESAWLVNGVAAWILVPLVVALLTVPGTFEVLKEALAAERSAAGYTFLFGLLWGVGGLTFGLSLRYLGVALGTTVALGCCAAFGTLVPPIIEGTLAEKFASTSGLVVLAGLLICFAGIAVGGYAGLLRERGATADKQDGEEERDTRKGVLVAVVSGLLSACFAFGLASGAPIAELAVARQTAPLFQSSPVLVILLWGGFLTNVVYCLYRNGVNKTFGDYGNSSTPLVSNYLWAGLAGMTWYFQFMFYGMGSTFLGPAYDFASWSIHMAFIIFFGNAWGLYFDEWAGVSRGTKRVLYTSLALLLVSVILIGAGS
ncbi:L-rhamnose/proton symporter RhaT [Neolewinella antarctica]|uniref:L-rhamnose-H+ transport protein n=1 Tax=Neolewinella antarctica TaxID=442734 RepID=A0ABX0XFD7_9BACT|nr:L-rhamnose/proton symporter RhaT [Neolewinella antarctica]NJC27619.1 L-rhamnose-H+ transport protein [Neolewinella antarctica]